MWGIYINNWKKIIFIAREETGFESHAWLFQRDSKGTISWKASCCAVRFYVSIIWSIAQQIVLQSSIWIYQPGCCSNGIIYLISTNISISYTYIKKMIYKAFYSKSFFFRETWISYSNGKEFAQGWICFKGSHIIYNILQVTVCSQLKTILTSSSGTPSPPSASLIVHTLLSTPKRFLEQPELNT